MKPTIWFLPVLILAGWAMELQAQFPYPPPGSGGISFGYRSNRLSVSGYLFRGYPPGYYIAPPVVPYGPYYDPYYYGPPTGIIQTRNVIQVITPPPVFAPNQDIVQDVSGVDLDLISPPRKIGPDLPKENEQKIPGKDVSVPKKPVRPDDVPKQQVPPPGQPKQPANPRQQSDLQLELGAAAFANAQYGLAAQRFRLATQTDPTNAMAFFLLAQGYFALNQYDEAAAAIHKGMDLDPNWPQAKFRPRLDLYKGIEAEFAAHLQRLEKVVEANPKADAFLFLLGYQYWFDGQQQQALKRFQQARPLAADPTHIDRFLKAGLPGVVAAK
jgi:hypothetical protein